MRRTTRNKKTKKIFFSRVLFILLPFFFIFFCQLKKRLVHPYWVCVCVCAFGYFSICVSFILFCDCALCALCVDKHIISDVCTLRFHCVFNFECESSFTHRSRSVSIWLLHSSLLFFFFYFGSFVKEDVARRRCGYHSAIATQNKRKKCQFTCACFTNEYISLIFISQRFPIATAPPSIALFIFHFH